MCRFVGTVPDIWGLVWPNFKPNSGSESKISGRILNNSRDPFSPAELRAEVRPGLAQVLRKGSARTAPPSGKGPTPADPRSHWEPPGAPTPPFFSPKRTARMRHSLKKRAGGQTG